VRLPGAAYEYWNGGYALLAGIVERASGQSFTTFCNEHLFRPAGLERTGFTGDALPREVQAVGYDGDTAVRLAAEHPYGSSYGWQYRGMGGIVTSASELHRFVRALESGLVLKPESVRLMQTRVSASYGLGWGVTETKRKTRRISHGGDVRGFHTQLLRFPDEDGVIILLSNVEGVPLWTLAWNLEAELFGGPHSYPVPPAAVPLPEPVLDRLCGTFALPNGGGRLVLEREGQAVRVCAEGSAACALLTGCEPPAGIGASVSATRLYVPVTATELATFDWMAPTRLPRLRLEPHDDAPSHLIAHTPGGRETRLTEER
jgi:hypothetical protein